MSCCCSATYKFCSPVNTCDANTFKAMFTALTDGSYTVQLHFLGASVNIPITVAAGVVTLTNDLNLNEKYTYTAKVINAGGFEVTLYYNTVAYDCIQFNTKLISS
jgi:hypothetical protein